MNSPPRAESISYAEFTGILSRYPALIASQSKPSSKQAGAAIRSLDTLEELDEYRIHAVPAELAKLDKKHLTKEQVELLIKWKLKHGKWRPRLANLVSSNSSLTIENTTRDAFALHSTNVEDPQPALNMLSRLSGIGPASASLLLSVYDPNNVPFFSDEAFRWVNWEEGKGKGWDRKIGYNVKEYDALVEAVRKVRKRLEAESGGKPIGAGEVERVGWVIGREEEREASVSKGSERKRGLAAKTSKKEEKVPTTSPAPKESKKPAKGSMRQSDVEMAAKRKSLTKAATPLTAKEDAQEPRRSKRIRSS
ncbi:hypothetical protein FGG08_002129 [Glutinoglossum americanum]|uniref:Uncharacterized protein n=1 Tax=Glutinoglossum americanum TaxID=1670608 RepID=A0A9P8L4R0_9PEZI|nr:hypothetical protein FGG08_002129 [Glutinoglossum americanum]